MLNLSSDPAEASDQSSPDSGPENSEADALYRFVDELTERIFRGEQVDFEEELKKQSANADQLRDVFAALDLMGVIRQSTLTPTVAQSVIPDAHPIAGIVGDFRIQREIGRGGMGVVYEAEQISLQRFVALKIFPFAGICAPRQLQRFQHEAKAAASLHHPHIVPVYAVGCERGIHFYAMQYIEGQSLACLIQDSRNDSQLNLNKDSSVDSAHTQTAPIAPSAIETKRPISANTAKSSFVPTIRQIATWGVEAAEALDYAHSLGVIHRDIKPANILLDTQGRIWVTDFGLAQIATAEGLTITGDIVGTLRYMSPEQAVGERGLLDQRTDIYSLGATLYELMTLEPVFGGSDRATLLHKIIHDEPTPIKKLNPSVPRELATIVHKALERDLNTRYLTAGHLADDLRRFLNEQPIRAKQPTIIDRCRKWSRRNRSVVRLASVFGCVMLLILGAAAFVIDRERQKHDLVEQTHKTEQQVAQRILAINRYVSHVNHAEHALKSGNLKEVRRYLSEAIPPADDEDFRGFEWNYLWYTSRDPNPPLGQHQGMAYCIRLSPDGRIIATGGQDGIRLWDAATFAPLGHLTDHQTDVNGIAFSADGSQMATAGDDHNVRIWTTHDWKVKQILPHIGNVVAAMFIPGQNRLVSAERHYDDPMKVRIGENVVWLWETVTWERLGSLQRHDAGIEALDVNSDGTLVATGSDDGTASLWDLKENKLRHRLKHSPTDSIATVDCVTFSQQSPTLYSGSFDGGVRLWDIESGALTATLPSNGGRIQFIAFSPDEKMFVAGGSYDNMMIWHRPVEGRKPNRPDIFLKTPGEIWGAKFLTQDRFIVACRDGAIREWDACSLPTRRRIPMNEGRIADIELTRDGQYLVNAGNGISIYRVSDGKLIQKLFPSAQDFSRIAVDADGTISAASTVGSLIQWKRMGNSLWSQLGDSHAIPRKIYQLDCYNGIHLFRDVDAGQLFSFDKRQSRIDSHPITGLMSEDITFVSSESNLILVAKGCGKWPRGNGGLEAWQEDHLIWRSDQSYTDYNVGAISADGTRLAIAERSGSIHVFRAADGTLESEMLITPAPWQLALSPDGRTIASSARNDDSQFHDTIKIHNVSTGRQLLEFETGCGSVSKLTFSADARTLAAFGRNILGVDEILLWTTGRDSIEAK